MPSYKKSSKISNYESTQKEFLEKLRDKGFKDAKVIDDFGKHHARHYEDKELLIIK